MLISFELRGGLRSAIRKAWGAWRALDYGGVVFETQAPETLTEAMVALEQGIAEFRNERA